MKINALVSSLCAVLCMVLFNSCNKPAEVLTFDTAEITHFDDYTDPAHPFVWLYLDLEKDTVSYSLVLQLTLPAEAEMPDIIGKPQTMTTHRDAEAFAIRPGYTEGDIVSESYLIGISNNEIAVNPVVDAAGVITINDWNGFDSDEVGSIDLDVTVTTDSAVTCHFNYNGTVSMDFFHRVRSRSQNPASANSNLYFRNLTKCPDSSGESAVGVDRCDIIELSNDDATSFIRLVCVMPDDSSVRDKQEVTFTISDEGTPFTVRPGWKNGADVGGSFVGQCYADGDDSERRSVKNAIKSGTVTVRHYSIAEQESDFWDDANIEGVFVGEDGTIYNLAYIFRPPFLDY